MDSRKPLAIQTDKPSANESENGWHRQFRINNDFWKHFVYVSGDFLIKVGGDKMKNSFLE
jgi:hypothetical protein